MTTEPERERHPAACDLCGRVTRRGTTAHHLIPRTVHSNKWFRKRFTREEMRATIPLCRDCHSAVHRLVPREKELGRYFFSRERLLDHPEIARYVAWVAKRR